MTTGLPISRIVNVTSSFASQFASASNTSSLVIVGDSDVINGRDRLRTYPSLAAVGSDFGITSPEYQAASDWFAGPVLPMSVLIGRWIRTASRAHLTGGYIAPALQMMTAFNAITNGGMTLPINGTNVALTGLNFSSATNLNGVASLITTALGANGFCVWNATQGYFDIATNSTGGGLAASDMVIFSGTGAGGDTLTINSVVITLVATSPTGNQVLIGATPAATAANVLAFLQASQNAALTPLVYSASGPTLTVAYASTGTAGNAVALSKTSTAITLSSATLAGGTVGATIGYAVPPVAGQDVSALLQLSAATASPPAPGYNAESAVAALLALDNAPPYFYGATLASPNATDADQIAFAAYIEGTRHTNWVSTQNPNVVSTSSTNDLVSLMKAAGYQRSFGNYSSTNAYSGAGLAAIPLTIDYGQQGSAATVKFKQLDGIAPENFTLQQAVAAGAKRINYFVNYNNGTAILEEGVAFGTAYIDEIVGVDAITFDIQAAEYNLLLSVPKVDQTDAGMGLLSNVDDLVLEKYVGAGFLDRGHKWTGPSFGALKTGDTLPAGYYVYRAPIALQSSADRQARKAVPAQIALGLAGAVHSSSVLLNVNR